MCVQERVRECMCMGVCACVCLCVCCCLYMCVFGDEKESVCVHSMIKKNEELKVDPSP